MCGCSDQWDSQLFSVIVKEYKISFPVAVVESTNIISFVNISLFSFISLGCKASEVHQLVGTGP